MEMLLVDAPAYLKSRVISLWSLRGHPEGLYSGLPKPFVEMVISLSGHHYWQADELSAPLDFTKGWVTPLQSGPRFAQTCGPLHLIGARLSIETASSLFGPDINRDTGAPIPIDDVMGRDALILREDLLEIDTEANRLLHLSKWLSERLKNQIIFQLPSHETVTQFAGRTDMLAEYLGLSSRGLRKRFKTKLGVGPKFWLQLNRFDTVLNSQISKISLAQTALIHGYTDQAHMTSEFKRFAGRPPRDYLKLRDIKMAPEDAPHFMPNSN